jgi:hypothetical protein
VCGTYQAVPVTTSGQRATFAIPGQPSNGECFCRVDVNGGGFVTWE